MAPLIIAESSATYKLRHTRALKLNYLTVTCWSSAENTNTSSHSRPEFKHCVL